MPTSAEYRSLPFDEAIQFFRQKLNLPAERWDSIHGEMHSRAFVIAGAVRDDIVADFRHAIDKAISEGGAISEFRRDFDKIVERYGWSYNGNRRWRTNIIFNTNITSAYAAGHWQSIIEDEDIYPYLIYHTMDDGHVRDEHLAWDGLILPVRHSFWQTHYPPNGWGCRCYVDQLTADQAKALLKKPGYTDKAPEIVNKEVTNPRTGEVRTVTEGIDEGWDYNVGIAAWGRPHQLVALQQHEKKWDPLVARTHSDYGRPYSVPITNTDMQAIDVLTSVDETVAELKKMFKGNTYVNTLEAIIEGNKFSIPLVIDAQSFGEHLALNIERTRFLPFIGEVLNNPYEVWMNFEKSRKSGKVVIRFRYIKAIRIDKDKALVVVLDSVKNSLTGWTFFESSRLKTLNTRRKGVLVYSED